MGLSPLTALGHTCSFAEQFRAGTRGAVMGGRARLLPSPRPERGGTSPPTHLPQNVQMSENSFENSVKSDRT